MIESCKMGSVVEAEGGAHTDLTHDYSRLLDMGRSPQPSGFLCH